MLWSVCLGRACTHPILELPNCRLMILFSRAVDTAARNGAFPCPINRIWFYHLILCYGNPNPLEVVLGQLQ